MNVLLPNNAFFFLIRHQNISLPQGNEGLRDKNAGEIQKSCLNSLIFGENSILKTHLGTGVIEMDEMIRKNWEAKYAMVSGKTWMCGAWRILCGGSVEVTRLGASAESRSPPQNTIPNKKGTCAWLLQWAIPTWIAFPHITLVLRTSRRVTGYWRGDEKRRYLKQGICQQRQYQHQITDHTSPDFQLSSIIWNCWNCRNLTNEWANVWVS